MSFSAKTRRRLLAIAAGTLLLAACGSDSSSSDTSVADTTAAVADTTAAAADTTPDAAATEPERIVSLSATATEMLYALGAEDQIVAVDNYSNYPEAAAAFEPKIDAFEPSVEAISELDPTVVLITYDPGNLQEQLEKLEIDVWLGAAATTLDDSYKQISELGELTGKTAEADALVESMRTKIDEVVSGTEAPAEGISYFYELDTNYYSLTSNTFVGQLFSLFGTRNIADTAEAGNDYPQLSQEFIISANPQMIFLADTKFEKQSAETVAARPGWNAIDAVKNNQVIGLDDDIASRWGPRVVDLVTIIADSLSNFSAAQ
jgi:iron complex transport system substrate-binding protein